MKHHSKSRLVALACSVILSVCASAQVPQLLNYQGRVAVGGVNFDGTGQFKFALVDGGFNQSVQATANAGISPLDGSIFYISVTNGGSGYVSAPVVTITATGGGSGATAVAIVANGTVSSIQITNQGSGYSGLASVTIDPPPPNVTYSYYWKNDGGGPTPGDPTTAVALPVNKGLYSILLGDTTIPNMAALSAGLFTAPDLRLRVWFNDGVNGFQLLAPDQRITAVGYAMMAADVADGAITSAKIVDGSVTSAKIVNGAITSAKILNAAIGSSQLAANAVKVGNLFTDGALATGKVLSFNGTNLNWINPGPANALTLPLTASGFLDDYGNAALFDIYNTAPLISRTPSIRGNSVGGIGVEGSTQNGLAGVHGKVGVGGSGSYGVYGAGQDVFGVGGIGVGGDGVIGVQGIGKTGVHGASYGTGETDAGVIGESNNGVAGFGVYGIATGGGTAVYGTGGETGVYGRGNNDGVVGSGDVGVFGSGNSVGVWGLSASLPGHYAGYFQGSLGATGAKTFQIDHPLDPANKYLVHAAVESPDVKNIYDGTIVTDENGAATVTLPGYFEALNRDFRYQLTCIGQFAQAIVSSEVAGNRFTIQTDKPDVKVSWQVTGIRQDAYMQAHPMVVEQDKPKNERGTYQHPELFNQPEEKSLLWKHNPTLGARLKAERIERKAAAKPAGK